MQRVPVSSTLLRAAAYQVPSSLLELEFRSGVVYIYLGVPAQMFEELLQAKSKGGYFNRHIRNRFASFKVQPPWKTGSLQFLPTDAAGKATL